MMAFINNLGWPVWCLLCFTFLSHLVIVADCDGEPAVHESGPEDSGHRGVRRFGPFVIGNRRHGGLQLPPQGLQHSAPPEPHRHQDRVAPGGGVVHHHPYMEQRPQDRPPQDPEQAPGTYQQTRRSDQDWPQGSGPYDRQQVAGDDGPPAAGTRGAEVRRLQLPIISEGYASTKFQGGERQGQTPTQEQPEGAALPDEIRESEDQAVGTGEDNDLGAKVDDDAASEVPEEQGHPDEEAAPRDTFAPPSVISWGGNNKPSNWGEAFDVQLSTSFGSKEGPSRGARPKGQLVAKGSVEEVPLYGDEVDTRPPTTTTTTTSTTSTPTPTTTTEDSSPFILEPGADYEVEAADASGKGDDSQYVRFFATPPKSINVNVPSSPLSSAAASQAPSAENVDESGYFRPPKVTAADSDLYQAGYQQVDPAPASQFPLASIDPDMYHEDRPSFPLGAFQGGGQGHRGPHQQQGHQLPAVGAEYFPLGRPPPNNAEAVQGIVRKPQPQRVAAQGPQVQGGGGGATTEDASSPLSFLEFLIPSFLTASSNRAADPEGPLPTTTRGQQQNAAHNLKRLPVPTRPPNTFPRPEELGGRLNPIMIRLPPGGGVAGPTPDLFPKPPTVEDWEAHHRQLQQRILMTSRTSKPAAGVPAFEEANEDSLNEIVDLPDDGVDEEAVPDDEDIIVPQRPKEQQAVFSPDGGRPTGGLPWARHRDSGVPIGGRRPPAGPAAAAVSQQHQQQQPQQQQNLRRPPLPKRPLNNVSYKRPPHQVQQQQVPADVRQRLKEEYLAKLDDPNFVQNLTKALVFHHRQHPSDGDEGGAVVAAGDLDVVSSYRTQDSNPFFFRPNLVIPPDRHLRPNLEDGQDIVGRQGDNFFGQGLLYSLPAAGDADNSAQSPSRGVPWGSKGRPEAFYRAISTRKPVTLSTAPETSILEGRSGGRARETTETPAEAQVDSGAISGPVDVVAHHANSLLMHYLTTSTEGPVPEAEGTRRVFDEPVLEYLPSDSEASETSSSTTAAVEEDSVAAASASNSNILLTRDIEEMLRSDDAAFSSYLTHLDQTILTALQEAGKAADSAAEDKLKDVVLQQQRPFQPSSKPSQSDWFILNDQGQRQRKMTDQEIREVTDLLSTKSSFNVDGHEGREANLADGEDFEDESSSSTTLASADRTAEMTFDLEDGFEPSVGIGDIESR